MALGSKLLFASLVAASASLFTKPTLAAEPLDDTLHFSADEAEAELDPPRLRLLGEVVVTAGTYRLSCDELAIVPREDALLFEGPARLHLCECESLPLALGFDGALVEKDGDLILDAPRLEVREVTVFGLPWFWLRPPSRPGLLPPRIAWRGRDGLFLGGGVHLPWSEGENALALGAGAYMRGGFETTAALRTQASTASIRWDRRGEDLVALDARGSAAFAPTMELAWQVDAIRGPRALPGTVDLAAASRPYDRAEVTSSAWLGPVLVGTGFRAYGARNSFASGHALGPRLSLASGSTLGGFGSWEAQLLGETLWIEDGLTEAESAHAAHADAGLDLATPAGPLVLSHTSRLSSLVVRSGPDASLDAGALSRLRAALPLVRRFGSGEGELVHLIEPRAEVSAHLARTSGPHFEDDWQPLGEARSLLAAMGIHTGLAPSDGHRSTSLDLSLGALLPSRDPVVFSRASHATRHFGLSAEGAARRQGERWGRALIAHARLGPIEAGHLLFHVAHREGLDPKAARLLRSDGPRPAGYLAWPGTSAGGAVAMPIAPFVVRAGADLDVDRGSLLGARSSAEWRHPCGCLSAGLHGQHRFGREGVDVFATLDLGR